MVLDKLPIVLYTIVSGDGNMTMEWSDGTIANLAEVGAGISRHLRHPWTGEQLGVSISLERLSGRAPRYALAALEGLGLLALEDVADLNQVRFVRGGQHSWRQGDWERAIREKAI